MAHKLLKSQDFLLKNKINAQNFSKKNEKKVIFEIDFVVNLRRNQFTIKEEFRQN